jgi:hypothetical protein
MRQHSFPDARVCMGCGPTPTAHSGLLAVRDAARRLGTRDLSQCEVYSTATQCAMCQGALYWARVRRGYSPRARWRRGSSQGSDVVPRVTCRPAQARRDIYSRALLGAWQTPGAPAGHMAVSGPEAQLSRSIHAATADLARRCLARRKAQNEGRYDQSNNHKKRQGARPTSAMGA